MTTLYGDFKEDSNLEEQRQLYAKCFHESHVAAGAASDYYQWKFRTSAASDKPKEFGAWKDSKLVGYVGALPFRYQIGDQSVLCGMICDVMTHSSVRKRGVFTSLGNYSLKRLQEEGFGMALTFPIRPQVLPGFLKTGWKVAFKLPLYVKILKTKKLLQKRPLSFLSPVGDVIVRSYNSILESLNSVKSPNLKVESLSKEDFFAGAGYSDFFQKWCKTQKNYLLKDMDFLKWRLATPGIEYKIVIVREVSDSSIAALAIVRKNHFQGVPCLAILDMMSLRLNQSMLSALHKGVEKEAIDLGADVIACMMSRKTSQRFKLVAHGYFRGPSHFKFIFNRFDKKISLDSLGNEDHWNLTWIDSDDN